MWRLWRSAPGRLVAKVDRDGSRATQGEVRGERVFTLFTVLTVGVLGLWSLREHVKYPKHFFLLKYTPAVTL